MLPAPSTIALKPAIAVRSPSTPRQPTEPAAHALPPSVWPLGRPARWPLCHVVSQHGSAWYFHDAADIGRFYSANKYTCFVAGGKEHLCTESLTSLAKRLAGMGFLRTHRADLINLAHVHSVKRAQHTFELTLKDGQKVMASRRLVRALRASLAF